jgi:hypothetical protein
MNNEIWKPIINYNLYEISNIGNIRNSNTKQLLKQTIKNNYYYINICKKSFRVNRLVANTFLDNNDIKNQIYVNHIDGNKKNNNVNNLEFITPSNNVKHAIKNNLLIINKCKVGKYNKNTDELIQIYDSIIDASNNTNIDDATICKVCKYYQTGNGKNKSAGGYIWKYMNNTININQEEELYKIKDYPNYKITKTGKVYSYHRKKYLTLNMNDDGYIRVYITNENGRRGLLVHRLVAITFIPNPENKNQVNHKNMKKNDNSVDNLEWATESENVIHANLNKVIIKK